AALANHYGAAEVWEKTLTYSRRAGTRAMRFSAYRDAAAWFEQALQALCYLPETRENTEAAIDLRFDLRNALHPLGETDRIRQCWREAEALISALDDHQRLAWLSVYLAYDRRLAGHLTAAVERARLAQSLSERLGDRSLRLRAGVFLGAAHLSLGDFRR